MQWRLLACPADRGRRKGAEHRLGIGPFAVLLIIPLVQGCAAAALPSVSADPAPSNPSAPAPRVSYRSTIGPYTSMRPVEPAPWQKQNEQVAPSPKSSE
jgi:hypothetical protein